MPAGEKRLVFGKARGWERRLVEDTLRWSFGERTLDVLREGEIYAARAYWIELHLVSPGLEELITLLGRLGRHPYSAGLFLGWIRRRKFHPSLPLIQRITGLADKGIVRVAEKASQLFLYGRDVLCGSIKGFVGGRPRKGQLVIIANELGEPLGLGVFRGGKEVCVENKLDLGWYLRRAG